MASLFNLLKRSVLLHDPAANKPAPQHSTRLTIALCKQRDQYISLQGDLDPHVYLCSQIYAFPQKHPLVKILITNTQSGQVAHF